MRIINITKLFIIVGFAGCFFVSDALALGGMSRGERTAITQIWVDEQTQRVMLGQKGVNEFAFITIEDILNDPSASLAVRDNNGVVTDTSAYLAARNDNGEHALWYFAEYIRIGQLEKTVTCIREYIGNEDEEEALREIYADLVGGDRNIEILGAETDDSEALEGMTFDGHFYGYGGDLDDDTYIAGMNLGEIVWHLLSIEFPADAQRLEVEEDPFL